MRRIFSPLSFNFWCICFFYFCFLSPSFQKWNRIHAFLLCPLTSTSTSTLPLTALPSSPLISKHGIKLGKWKISRPTRMFSTKRKEQEDDKIEFSESDGFALKEKSKYSNRIFNHIQTSNYAKSRAAYLKTMFVTLGGSMIAIPTLLLNPVFTNAKEVDEDQVINDPDDEDKKTNREKVFDYLDSIEKLQIKVPDFQNKLQWIGSQPLSFQKSGEFKGKLVLLDFWTYCCINCMHILPSLKKFEDAYLKTDSFAVVGVHSPKFQNEKDFDNVANAVSRYNITHPVVNDASMSMWNSIGVSSWPTLALVGPRGNLVSVWSGEGFEDRIMAFLGDAINYYDRKGYLDKTPLEIDTTFKSGAGMLTTSSTGGGSSSPLSYPGRIIVNSSRGQLIISDSSNHRIVVTDLSGQYIKSYGNTGGIGGLEDGKDNNCLFQNPQGLALYGGRYVYVADTDNHAIRRIDLDTNDVITVAGNGEQGFDYSGGKKGKQQYLSSPWDIVLWKEPSLDTSSSSSSGDEINVPNPDGKPPTLLVAIAGTHQIWAVEGKQGGLAYCFSGTGRERELNGPDRVNSAWAQPSGLALSQDKKRLYVADSESSSIRCMELTGKGSVRTLVGGSGKPDGTNLFAFGDKDGDGVGAKLQHPLAVSVLSDISSSTNTENEVLDSLLVADSYNQKVKILTVKGGQQKSSIKTLAGIGGGKSISMSKNNNAQASTLDSLGRMGISKLNQATFWEPSGLTQDSTTGLVYVADTNNNAIKIMDINKNEIFNMDLSTIPSIIATSSSSSTSGKGSTNANNQELSTTANKPLLSKRRSRLIQSLLDEEPLSLRNGIIKLQIKLPPNTHFTDGVESRWQIGSSSGNIVKDNPTKGHIDIALKDLDLDVKNFVDNNFLELETAIYYCQEINGNVCKVDGEVIQIKWTDKSGGNTSTKLEYTQSVPITTNKPKNQPSF